MVKMRYIRLNNQILMPIMGHGIAVNRGDVKEQKRVEKGLELALIHGHRMIDTAKYYDQDEIIGRVTKKSGINRKDLFITSKIWPDIIVNTKEIDAWLRKALKQLNTDYLDQLLLHFPINKEANIKGWRVLEKYLEKGIVRSIGVSNYEIYELRLLLDNCTYKPQVNQFECSLMHLSFQLLHECNLNNIQVVGYTPLARFKLQKGEVGSDEMREHVKKAAAELKMTESQIMLSYLLGRGIIPIVRSNTESHIIDNLEVLNRQNDHFLAVRLLQNYQSRSRLMGAPDAIAWLR